ncbi:SMP-30/gluconolactonase/LRE family protein [Blastococcus sp. CCUG 61487]|uniref:SMP-30/gluconolactonase/LRE family protein n=1 Tax=Blastococcus sp. CCUG 61487 TaxID=1840703 RepID=UPI0010C136E8|nr:SMP-30/gluconolactonase/LRE family protein [Blastococcus sp. CCUG 61487]TKJ21331.1 gluconolactonase [Blastococcus sp. CCUG 61487]
MRAEQITAAVAEHGEGPVWSSDWGGLRWVDMLAGDVLHLEGDARVTRVHLADVVAVIRPRSTGGIVVATRDEVRAGFDLAELHTVARLGLSANLRLNDGCCDPDGRLLCGSMAYDETPGAGALYAVSSDGTVRVVAEGVGISNGLGFDRAGKHAFYVDTVTQRIDVFDYSQDEGLTARRPWAFVDRSYGRPDGLAVDAEGGVWVALFGGSAVARFAPDGTLVDLVRLPVRQVTSCAFGGPGLRTLFVTTSRHGLADPEPAAGALFAVPDCDVAGIPTLTFAA